MKRIIYLLLAVCMLLPLAACAGEETKTRTSTQTAESETKELSPEEKAKADEEFLESYLKDYREGKYEKDMYFLYENPEDYIELAEYKGLSYPFDYMVDETVTDEEVESYITQLYLSAEVTDDQYQVLTEGTVRKYDVVLISYRGVIDGVEAENATAEDQSLLIGSGSYIRGFEEGLIGKKVGEEVTLNLNFSPYYGSEDVAGKPVVFYVTVKEIKRPTLPEFKVEVINENLERNFASMEEAGDAIKSALTLKKKNDVHAALAGYLQEKVLAGCKVKEYPQREMDHYRQNYVDYYSQYLAQGEKLEEVCESKLGVSYEQFMKDAEEHARTEVAGRLMVLAIAKRENIVCTDEQLRSLILGMYQNETDGYYGNLKAMVLDYMDVYGADYYEYQVLGAAVMEAVKAAAVKEGA